MTYHEIFVYSDGWKARVYTDNRVVAELSGPGGKAEAIKAVQEWRQEHGIGVQHNAA